MICGTHPLSGTTTYPLRHGARHGCANRMIKSCVECAKDMPPVSGRRRALSSPMTWLRKRCLCGSPTSADGSAHPVTCEVSCHVGMNPRIRFHIKLSPDPASVDERYPSSFHYTPFHNPQFRL